MSFKTGFIQKDIFKAIKLSVKKDPDAPGDVSQFGALTTALASTVGTANIIGIGTAIALGGPGAVLWIWFTGIFGIATKYAETLIALKYRVRSEDGTMLGGAMYALDRGLNMKWLGIIFAVLASVCGLGIGCSVPANAVVSILKTNFASDEASAKTITYVTAVILCALVGVAIIGGVKSITKVSEKLVPFMAIFYVLGCLTILVLNVDVMGETISTIVSAAFTARVAGGGFIGSTVTVACRYGIARGLFSNESGMGSAPLVAAAAQTRNPKRQALVSMTGTFWDTVVVCLMTGLVLVSCIIKHPSIDATSGNGSDLTSQAFSTIPVVGNPILVVGLITFTFSTILGWYYYGERCAVYLFGEKIILVYKIIWISGIFIGSIAELKIIWNIADVLNGLMTIPNIIAVLLLSKMIAAETGKYAGKHIDDKDESEIPLINNSRKGVL
ncbi:MAG: alanine:cation symporter family protein [Lachnospiraceae bacterium]|nr:alanine:cation symporter family protein [Lachnospiraceae bacterium]